MQDRIISPAFTDIDGVRKVRIEGIAGPRYAPVGHLEELDCVHGLDVGTCALCNGSDTRDQEALGETMAFGFVPFVPTVATHRLNASTHPSYRKGGGGGCPDVRTLPILGDGLFGEYIPANGGRLPWNVFLEVAAFGTRTVIPFDPEPMSAWRSSAGVWMSTAYISDLFFDIANVGEVDCV